MKAITIKQPWASLIVNGYKRYEFRSWKTNYRGPLLIHAGKGIDRQAMKEFRDLNLDYPMGKLIGKATLVDCISMTNQFSKELVKENDKVYKNVVGRDGYAWQLNNIEKLEQPIEVTGKLSLWEYKD